MGVLRSVIQDKGVRRSIVWPFVVRTARGNAYGQECCFVSHWLRGISNESSYFRPHEQRSKLMTALLVHVSAMIEHVPDQHCAHHELNSAAP